MKAIAFFVITAHLAIGFLLAFWDQKAFRHPEKKREFVVKTVKLTPKQEVAVKEVAAISETPTPSPPKKSSPAPKKPIPSKKKEVIKKNTPIKKQTPPSPSPPPEKTEWVALAKEKIGKITAMKEIASTTPTAIENLESELSIQEMAYRDELMHRLRLHLKLPHYGEVKIQLTIDRSGKVSSVKVLSYQSAENAESIKKHLPKLQMPAFGVNFPGLATYDFTIVLSNESSTLP